MNLTWRRSPLSRALKSSFLRATAVIAGGSLVAQAAPALLTPVITRIYSPADMGVLGLYLSFIGVIGGVVSFGYPQAIVSADNESDAAHLAFLSFCLVLPASLAASALFWTLIKFDRLGYGDVHEIVSLAIFAALASTGIFSAARYLLIRYKLYREISQATVFQSVGRLGLQIALGILRPTWAFLILGELAGRGLGIRNLVRSAKQEAVRRQITLQRHHLGVVAKKYRKFPLLTTPSMLLDSLAANIPTPLIAAQFGIVAAGQYAVANRILLLPMSLIGASVADIFHSRMAEYVRDAPSRARRFFFTIGIALFLVGLIPSVVIALFGPQLWTLILGSSWELSGTIAAALAPRVLTQFTVSPLSRIVLVYQGQEYKLIYDILSVIMVLGVFFVASTRSAMLIDTLSMLAWGQVALHVVYFALLSRIVVRNARAD